MLPQKISKIEYLRLLNIDLFLHEKRFCSQKGPFYQKGNTQDLQNSPRLLPCGYQCEMLYTVYFLGVGSNWHYLFMNSVFYSMSVLYGLTSQWNQLTRIPHTKNVRVSGFDIQCISVVDAAGRTVEQKHLGPGFDSHLSH